MNAVIKSLYERKSVRVYEDRPIPEEMKQVHENTYHSMDGSELRKIF